MKCKRDKVKQYILGYKSRYKYTTFYKKLNAVYKKYIKQ